MRALLRVLDEARGSASVRTAPPSPLVPVIAMSTNTCRFVSPALFALLLSTAPASAQVQSSLRAWGGIPVDSGTFLRITAHNGSTTEGRLVARSGDGLLVTPSDGAPVADGILIRSADISGVEMRTTSRHVAKGAGSGVLAGAVGGLFAGVLGCSSASGQQGENLCGLGYLFFPPILGFIGGVAGAVIGLTQHEETWTPVLAPSP